MILSDYANKKCQKYSCFFGRFNFNRKRKQTAVTNITCEKMSCLKGGGGWVTDVIFNLHLGVGHEVLCQTEGVGHVFFGSLTDRYVEILNF